MMELSHGPPCEAIVVLSQSKSSLLSSLSSHLADQLACWALWWQHMSPPVQSEWPSSVPTVKSYLLFPVMNLLFTEIDLAFFLQIAAVSGLCPGSSSTLGSSASPRLAVQILLGKPLLPVSVPTFMVLFRPSVAYLLPISFPPSSITSCSPANQWSL